MDYNSFADIMGLSSFV